MLDWIRILEEQQIHVCFILEKYAIEPKMITSTIKWILRTKEESILTRWNVLLYIIVWAPNPIASWLKYIKWILRTTQALEKFQIWLHAICWPREHHVHHGLQIISISKRFNPCDILYIWEFFAVRFTYKKSRPLSSCVSQNILLHLPSIGKPSRKPNVLLLHEYF